MKAAVFGFLAVALLLKGAEGATPDVDGACTSADTCTSTATPALILACDFYAASPLCKIQADAACDPSASKCVSGATCDGTSSLCVCDATFTKTSTKLCAGVGTIGGTCTYSATSAKGDCTDPNAVCPQSPSICACKEEYTLSPTTRLCVEGGASGVIVSMTTLVLAAFVSLLTKS